MVNIYPLYQKERTSAYPRKLFSIWFISLVCIALGVVTTPHLSVVSFLLFFAALLFLQTEEIFALLFGLLPFANIFKLSTASMSLFTICEIGAVIYLVLKKRLKASQFMLLIALIAYLIISSPSNLNLFTVVKVAAGFLLIGFVVSVLTQDGLKQTALMLSLGTIAMLLLSTNQRYLSYVEKYFTDMNDLKQQKNDTVIASQNHMIGIGASFSQKNPFGYMDAFNSNFTSGAELSNIVHEAMEIFENAFGKKSETFVASCFVWDGSLEKSLAEVGVRGIQSGCWKNVPAGVENGNAMKRRLRFLGQKNRIGQVYTVINCVYEPAYQQNPTKSAKECYDQIMRAFQNRKPAIINSHRFNYIGSINREKVKYALSKFFIPYNVIKFHYPILQKHRWLTPIMEVRRWGKLIFCGHLKRTVKELKYNSTISVDAAAETRALLKNVGL